jgi:hypothetical protein
MPSNLNYLLFCSILANFTSNPLATIGFALTSRKDSWLSLEYVHKLGFNLQKRLEVQLLP